MDRSGDSTGGNETEVSVEQRSSDNKPSEKADVDSSQTRTNSRLITDEELQNPERFAEVLHGQYGNLDAKLLKLAADRAREAEENKLGSRAMEGESGEEQQQQDMDTWSQDGNHSASSNNGGNDNSDER